MNQKKIASEDAFVAAYCSVAAGVWYRVYEYELLLLTGRNHLDKRFLQLTVLLEMLIFLSEFTRNE